MTLNPLMNAMHSCNGGRTRNEKGTHLPAARLISAILARCSCVARGGLIALGSTRDAFCDAGMPVVMDMVPYVAWLSIDSERVRPGAMSRSSSDESLLLRDWEPSQQV